MERSRSRRLHCPFQDGLKLKLNRNCRRSLLEKFQTAPSAAGKISMAGVCHNCAFGADGNRRGSGLDSFAFADTGRNGLCLFNYSRRVSFRTWNRQRVGRVARAENLRPGILLGWCQFFLTAAIFWTAYMLAESLPFWPIDPSLTANAWFNFQLDLTRCLWALLPATILWGASFPLALAAAARGQDPARLVGEVYAANTVGGIIGGIGFSIVLIPWIGTQDSQRLLIYIAAAAAFLMFVCHCWKNISPAGMARGISMFAALVVFASALADRVEKIPGELVAYGRYMPKPAGRIGDALRRRGHEQFRGRYEG